MASWRIPGSQCTTKYGPSIDGGTLARVCSPSPQPVGYLQKRGAGRTIAVIQPMRRSASRASGGNAAAQIPQPRLVVTLDFVYLPPVRNQQQLLLDKANDLFACCGVWFDVVNSILLVHSVVEHYVPYGQMTRSPEEISSLMRFSRYWHDGPRTNGGTGPRTLDDNLHRLLGRLERRGRIQVFFVRETDGAAGFAIPSSLDPQYGGLGERIFIGDSARPETLAHELGHVLIDGRDRSVGRDDHHPDRNNLMAYGIDRTGTQLNPQQIGFIRQGAASGPQTRIASTLGRASSKRACC